MSKNTLILLGITGASFLVIGVLSYYNGREDVVVTKNTDLVCESVSEVSTHWNNGLNKMIGQVERETENKSVIKLTGMTTDHPIAVGDNYTADLLLIKNDSVTQNYQYFEKSNLGTPVLWSFYPKEGKNITKLRHDVLIRIRSYRDSTPHALATVYECIVPAKNGTEQ